MNSQPVFWGRRGLAACLLLPLAWLFQGLSSLRRLAYRQGLLSRTRLPVPVVVVGNISVGGTGKTPFIAWLARYLRHQGWRPGIVARGYGGRAGEWPQMVESGSDPEQVGDEPVMLAAATGCPLAVGPDRPAAARMLLERGCDIILSDDGLQHYALERDFEIVLIDGERGLGNRFLLPAGPLRESAARLKSVDLVLQTGGGSEKWPVMRLRPVALVNLADPQRTGNLQDFVGRPLVAVAGIGNPVRFFQTLRAAGLDPIERPFPDHHRFRVEDLDIDPDQHLIMTEKDAVKCRNLACDRHWYLRVEAELPEIVVQVLNQYLRGVN